MEQQKKRNRLISLAVCLLMLATLMAPLNVQVASAASTLQDPRIEADGTITWDCVYFGHYPQRANGKGGFDNEPIKWRVLSINGDDAFLLSDKNLDVKAYNEEDDYVSDITWETCTLRSWLNGYSSTENENGLDYSSDNFKDTAFNQTEQNAILEKTIKNEDNPVYETDGGNDTKDKVFLLSIDEIRDEQLGFPEDPDFDIVRGTINTEYASSKEEELGEETFNWWWLRSPGQAQDVASCVRDDGYLVYWYGLYNSDYGTYSVRPAIYLDLSSNVWVNAGTVSCKGNVEESVEPPIPSKPTTPTAKASQTITAKSFTKTYGNKPFSLGAKAKTKLSYKSSDTKVATVSNNGQVTLKGPGKATITITAAATSQYNAATKKITITVKPKQTAGLKVKKGKKRMTVSWKWDKKATGYQITYAQNKKFKKGKKTITISKNKTIKRTVKKLKARKTYYVKVRAYKKVGKTKIYGAYSKVKKVNTR